MAVAEAELPDSVDVYNLINIPNERHHEDYKSSMNGLVMAVYEYHI